MNSNADRQHRFSLWAMEGKVVSTSTSPRLSWQVPWLGCAMLLSLGAAAFWWKDSIILFLWPLVEMGATLLGYLLVLVVGMGVMGPFSRSLLRGMLRMLGVCARLFLQLPLAVLRGFVRPRRVRRICQAVVVHDGAGRRRLLVLPVGRGAFYVRAGDQICVWGWPWRGALKGCGARNVTTGQTWGFRV